MCFIGVRYGNTCSFHWPQRAAVNVATDRKTKGEEDLRSMGRDTIKEWLLVAGEDFTAIYYTAILADRSRWSNQHMKV